MTITNLIAFTVYNYWHICQ